MAQRVLVTGADTFWGGRMIQALETDPNLELILGMGARTPSVPFERAEFVRQARDQRRDQRIDIGVRAPDAGQHVGLAREAHPKSPPSSA